MCFAALVFDLPLPLQQLFPPLCTLLYALHLKNIDVADFERGYDDYMTRLLWLKTYLMNHEQWIDW